MNRSLLKKLKTKQLKNTHYIFKDIPIRNEFGIITTLHTFGSGLKWNPHIHCLVSELVYSLKTNKLKNVPPSIIESGGLSKPEERNRLYKEHPKDFYVYAKSKSTDNDSNNSKNIQGCVNYFIRYAARPHG